jgi:CheY-like chemotaxis protein
VVASNYPERRDYLARIINTHIGNAILFLASDGFEALFKMENSPPHVFIVDIDLPKFNGIEMVTKMFANAKLAETSVIIVSPIPDKEHFVDQVVTGQVQFLADLQSENSITAYLNRALNRLSGGVGFSYQLKFMAPDEILFREGESAQNVYIVKRGQLQAYKGEGVDSKILGPIETGEFVGEMAHINGEPRSATVKALTDCEMIEIPVGTLDTILFTKPAWSKALVATLSRRLKRSNTQK